MVYPVKRKFLSSRRIAALVFVICAFYILPFHHPRDEVGGEEGKRRQPREETEEGEEESGKITGEERVKPRWRPSAPSEVLYFGRVEHALGGETFEEGVGGRLGEAKQSGEFRDKRESVSEEDDTYDSGSYPGYDLYDYTSEEEEDEGFEVDYGQVVSLSRPSDNFGRPVDDYEGEIRLQRDVLVVQRRADEGGGEINVERDGELEVENVVDQELAEFAREEESVALAVYNGNVPAMFQQCSRPRFTLHDN